MLLKYQPISTIIFEIMTNLIIGNITLNISFGIYLILYVPQMLHNKNKANLKNVSIYWHSLMYTSFSLDFFYGISMHFAWQYCLVSTIGLIFIMSQQWLLYKLYKKIIYLNILIAHCIILLTFFCYFHMQLDYYLAQIFSGIARSAGILAMLPQIKYNYTHKTAQGLNKKYLQLNLLLVTLDTTSAWLLNWGWPNKIATPTAGCLYFILWLQNKKFTQTQVMSYQKSA